MIVFAPERQGACGTWWVASMVMGVAVRSPWLRKTPGAAVWRGIHLGGGVGGFIGGRFVLNVASAAEAYNQGG